MDNLSLTLETSNSLLIVRLSLLVTMCSCLVKWGHGAGLRYISVDLAPDPVLALEGNWDPVANPL